MKTTKYTKFLTFFLSFALIASIEVNAKDDVISSEKLAQIEERVNDMSTLELSDRLASLMDEAEALKDEQSSSQSPSRQKAISSRLSEITAEMSAIQKVLSVVLGAAAINAITDDDKKDMLPPVVTLNGASSITVELGTAFTDPGASATDLKDGALSVSVSGSVDTSTVGSYTLTYSATDAAGNSATATRTVNVVDTTAPVVTVTGDNPANAEFGGTYSDAGATATDAWYADGSDPSIVQEGKPTATPLSPNVSAPDCRPENVSRAI